MTVVDDDTVVTAVETEVGAAVDEAVTLSALADVGVVVCSSGRLKIVT